MHTLETDISDVCSNENVLIGKQQYTLNDTNTLSPAFDRLYLKAFNISYHHHILSVHNNLFAKVIFFIARGNIEFIASKPHTS